MDPLDAYMAEVQEEVKKLQEKPKTVRLHQAARCDEIEDPAADFLQVLYLNPSGMSFAGLRHGGSVG